ncbi:MAG: chromate transporter [Thermacetogeniaceae bacterium]|jgi:chromate transporter
MSATPLDVFLVFLKVGLFSFGGGYAVIPVITADVVQQYHWLTATQFADLLALAQMTPGPVMVNIATLVGYRTAGLAGALLGVLGVVLPTFTLMLVLTYYYRWLSERGLVNRLARAFYPVLVALLASAAFFLAANSPLTWQLLVIAGLTVAVMAWRRPNPFWILLIAGVLGLLLNL